MKQIIRFTAVVVLFLFIGLSTSNAQTFSGGPSLTVPAAGNNGGFAWGDVNKDGKLDVVYRINNVMINSTTSFAALSTATLPTGVDAIGIAFADFNGDGRPDVYELLSTNVPAVYINNNGTSFAAMVGTGDLATAGATFNNFGGVSAADIDHSGYLSLAYAGGTVPASDANSVRGGGIWLLKGGASGFTNIGRAARGATANVIQNFESNNAGDAFAHIGWSATDISAIDTLDPLGGTNKVLKVAVNNYNAAPVLALTLPIGKTLADYNSFTFNGYFAQGDVGYKTIEVEAYQSSPTGHAFKSPDADSIGSWSRAKMGSTAWEPITIDITNTSSFSGTIYIAFGINCAGTGDVGGTGVQTIWYADNVTLVSPTGLPTSDRGIDTSLTFEAWNPMFLDANNDSYPDLLMPSFRNGSSQVDTGISGSRKGCVLYLNDGTGIFILPTTASVGRTLYNIDSIKAGVAYGRAVADTGIVVDDTVRHFEAIANAYGDFNNDGNLDLYLLSNSARNRNGSEVAVNGVILYGKGDGTFTYKWDGANIAASTGTPQIAGIRAISVGDYDNDGKSDLLLGCFGGGTFAQFLYKNNGDGTFTDVTTTANASGGGTRSVGFVDYDNNGFLDLFSYTGSSATLLKNNANNPSSYKWIGFQPVGSGMNGSAIGARFTVYAGATKQIRTISADAVSQGAGATLWAHFGLGSATFDSVYVNWPDGTTQHWTSTQLAAGDVTVTNKYWVIQEGAAIPPAPVRVQPSWVAKGDTALLASDTLKWTRVTGGNAAISYRVQVATNRGFTTLAKDLSNLTDSSTIVRLGLSTTYYWRVRGFSAGFTGPWSAADSFKTLYIPCTVVPQPLFPAAGIITVPNKPTLKVSYVSSASTYHLEVDTVNKYAIRDTVGASATTKYGGLVLNDSVNVLDTTYTFSSALKPGVKYYWRARGWNAAGSSGFSAVDSFTIMYVPAVPALSYPGHNAANVPANSLKMNWFSVAGDSNYVVQTWTYTINGVFTRNDTTKHDTTLTLTSLLNRQKYYWKVLAFNQGGASAFSAPDSFSTVIEVPAQVLVASPRNTTGENRKTLFTWNPALNAESYHLQVATTSAFAAADIKVDVMSTDTAEVISDTLLANTTYYWRVSGINLGGEGAFSSVAHYTTGTTVNVDNAVSQIPKEFALMQNYPNPFNPTTTITYDIPKSAFVSLKIYDVLGRLVTTLVDGIQEANSYRLQWNPTGVSSGVYFYRIQARSQDGSKNFTSVKKLVFMK